MALDYKSSLTRYRTYLQMVKSQPLWTASLWVILSLILLIVLLVMALRPTLVTISGLLGQIQQQKEISTRLDNKITLVQRAITEMNSVKNNLPSLEKALPKNANWNEIATLLSQIATSSGLTTSDLIIDKIPMLPNEPIITTGQKYVPQVPLGVIPIRFSLSLTGGYTQMRKAVSDLESVGRIVMITSIEIYTDKKGNQIMDLSGKFGYLPDQFL
jgi:Tfp pilus assembly protein PilO